MATYSSSDLPKPKMGPVKRSPFQQAFREARAAGKKDFTFNGKKYSTELAKPKAESAPKAAEGSGRGVSAGRTAADRDMGPGRPGPKTPAGPRRDTAAEAKGAETLERMKSRAERGMAVRSNEEMRDEAKGRTLGALGAAATLAGGPLARMAASRAASKVAPRVEPRVGRPVTTKLDDAAAAFSRPQARQASKDTGYTREAMPAKTAPKPSPAPKPRDEILKRQAAMREGRKSDVSLKEATEAAKKGRTEPTFKKGGSVRGGGCEARSKKTRYV